MLAMSHGHTDAVLFLIHYGANLCATDKYGRTALHRGVCTIITSFVGGGGGGGAGGLIKEGYNVKDIRS